MKKQFVFIFLFFLVIGSVIAQTKTSISVEELHRQMELKTADINSISCDFIQLKNLAYLDTEIESGGKLYFDIHNRLRWEYLTPYTYLITINKGTFSITSDGVTSAYDIESNRVFSQVSDLIMSSVNGTIFTSEQFDVEAYEIGDQYVIFMEPIIPQMKDILSKIELYISRADFSVNRVKMVEQEDNYTETSFINKKFNETLPDSLFSSK